TLPRQHPRDRRTQIGIVIDDMDDRTGRIGGGWRHRGSTSGSDRVARTVPSASRVRDRAPPCASTIARAMKVLTPMPPSLGADVAAAWFVTDRIARPRSAPADSV